MAGDAAGEQARAVLQLAAFGGLFAERVGIVLILGVDPRFRPVKRGVSIQPVVALRIKVIAQLGIALNGRAVGERIAGGDCARGLRIDRLLSAVVVITQRAGKRLIGVDF